jgi:hypothetical protein
VPLQVQRHLIKLLKVCRMVTSEISCGNVYYKALLNLLLLLPLLLLLLHLLLPLLLLLLLLLLL